MKADDSPLPHWETIFGMLSTTNGEILRYILAYNIPLEKLIQHELAMRVRTWVNIKLVLNLLSLFF